MHTEHDETIQALFEDCAAWEPLNLDDEQRKALETDSEWAVIAEDDFSQSHWVVDNLVLFDTWAEAVEYCESYENGDEWN